MFPSPIGVLISLIGGESLLQFCLVFPSPIGVLISLIQYVTSVKITDMI